MSLVEVGRVCVKTHGRESGNKCVVVERIDKNFVLITGPKKITGVRRRKANVDHLTPTGKKVDIKAGAEDEAISKAIESANLQGFMKEEAKE
ncbi:MAG: 50S ribosomal protein L14e [Candidatus Hermodarchaeia archaeon]|jgi:large subunit ribosomal protein L14e